MIQKISLIILSLAVLSGCNLAISLFDSTIEDGTEPTPLPTGEPTPLPTGEPPDPTIQNGDFETGDTTGWDGDFTVVEPAAHSGSYGARITCPDFISQNIKDLTPDTEYVLSLYTRFASMPAGGHVTIRYCEDEEITTAIFNENTEWNYLSIPFTPCSSSTEVTISIFCDKANMNIDDIILEEASGSD